MFPGAPLTRNLWLAGLLGAITGVISLAPEIKLLDQGVDKEKHERINIGARFWYTPLLWAGVTALLVYGLNQIKDPRWRTYWAAGLVLSVAIPTYKSIGHYAQDVYGVSTVKLFLTDLVFYTLLWGLGVQFLATRITGMQ